MDDSHQIHIPASFLALYMEPGQLRPRAGRAEISARYELCEDLAQHLVDYARGQQSDLGITEEDVLERLERGLEAPASGLAPPESRWIVRRLAELAGWPPAR
ncbi:MAG: ATPase with chaperone activity [Pseudomonadota bacterium]|nr:ATPase with chaperone activity [Pseudomonadota bacterium]